jgi:hypothetical protein
LKTITRILYVCLATVIVAGAVFVAGCTPEPITTTATITTTQTETITTTRTTTTTQTTTITILPSDAPLVPPSAEELAELGFMGPELPRITAAKLKQMMDKEESFILIDVRDGLLYNSKHLPQAISLPYNTGDKQIEGLLGLPKDRLLIFY